MAVTIKDVAREAEVSVTSAAVALRGDMGIMLKAETRQRIQEVAARLGYRRNAQASSLRSGRSDWVGLLVRSIHCPIVLAKIRTIEHGLRQHGFRCLLRETGGDAELEARFLDEFAATHVAGMIIADWPTITLGNALATYANRRYPPILSLELLSTPEPVDCVTVDRFTGGYLAGKHLLNLGHRRIARLTGPGEHDNTQARFRGLATAHEEAGVPWDASLAEAGEDYSFGGGHGAATRLFSKRGDFSALFCVNDEVAIGAMRAAREAGLRIPQDLSVVGFDDIPVAAFAPVPLTTVAQPVAEVVAAAMARFLPRLRGESTPFKAECHRLQMQLVVRDSTAAPTTV